MSEHDLFSNFARVQREMDKMMGDVWGRSRFISRASSGFSPNVDVYYCGRPERAVIKVDLAEIELSSINIEASGREVVISGERPVQETEGRVYQQVEILTGPFRRIVELQADVDVDAAKATYEDGILRIEIPLVHVSRPARRVPVSEG